MYIRALVLFILLVPSNVKGAQIFFEYNGGGDAWIGTSGLFLQTPLDSFGGLIPGVLGPADFTLTAGPPATVDVDAAGGTTYHFDDGLLQLESPLGAATIPVLAFSIELTPIDRPPFWGGLGPVAHMNGLHSIQLGIGVIAPGLAEALHVQTTTSGGNLSFVIDDFRGDQLAEMRTGVPNYNAGSFFVEAVPEPSLTVLGALGVISALVRKRTRFR